MIVEVIQYFGKGEVGSKLSAPDNLAKELINAGFVKEVVENLEIKEVKATKQKKAKDIND